ncbi:MAG TPA: NAD-dependent succinate-semialdehyde dehydrogenase [Terracidiphilus sp.]|nr:NAD-dependent succinate-semialdehyde dehydrogenase [Terracidiphilus sp.]
MENNEAVSYGSYLSGKWFTDGDRFQVVNPATAKPIAGVSVIGKGELQDALRFAEAVRPAWSAMSAKDRGCLLHKVADEIVRRKAEIARTITLENGKPLAQSEGEVGMTEDHLRWFAEEGRRVYGRIIPPQVKGKRHLVVKTPIGVVGTIAPWNFPLVLAVRKIAPAMAAGCPVILRPASQTPLSAVALAQCMEMAGVPAGVFQLAIGDAAMISDELLANPICRKISFTGSTRVGQSLIERAAKTVKPLSLELGGLAPVLVFDDCDLDVAVRETIIAKFRNTGQSCIAANRIYVQKTIYKEFVERFCAAVGKLKTGPGLDPGVDVGPVINQSGLDGALAQIEDAVRMGGKVVAGGGRIKDLPGFFMQPTVIEGMADDSACMQEETFAPMAPIISFDTEEEAIRRANDTPYGLSAYAMTRDIGRIFRLSEHLEAGTIGINDGAPTTSQCPFGGVKQSGWGRELGVEGLEAFVETKHVSIGGVQ